MIVGALAESVRQTREASGRHPQRQVFPPRGCSGDYRISLPKALAGRVTAQGGTLVVRIDYVTLGPIKDSSAWDNISGVAMIGGVQWPVRAAARYQASAIDQARFEESNHRRVTQLGQELTYWLTRDL